MSYITLKYTIMLLKYIQYPVHIVYGVQNKLNNVWNRHYSTAPIVMYHAWVDRIFWTFYIHTKLILYIVFLFIHLFIYTFIWTFYMGLHTLSSFHLPHFHFSLYPMPLFPLQCSLSFSWLFWHTVHACLVRQVPQVFRIGFKLDLVQYKHVVSMTVTYRAY